MNLRTRLSRSNGYRELGMFDESILELEAIEFGEDRWHPLVIEARYKTYRDAKQWELAKIMADLLTKRFPDQVEWLINKSEAMREIGDPLGAIQALLGEFMEARKFVRQAIKLDSKFRVEFLEDSAFDGVWESFWWGEYSIDNTCNKANRD